MQEISLEIRAKRREKRGGEDFSNTRQSLLYRQAPTRNKLQHFRQSKRKLIYNHVIALPLHTYVRPNQQGEIIT